MTVTCPRCGTRYRRPPDLRSDPDASYRCERCRHVFSVEPAADPPVEQEEEAAPLDDEPKFLRAEEEEEPVAPSAREKSAPRATRPAASKAAPARRPAASPTSFGVRAFLLLTIGYGILSVFFLTHPESMRYALRRIPLLGTTLAETRINPASVQLAQVRGVYQRVKGDRLVFVISGTAINNSPAPVKGVQIEGRVVGAEEQRQIVFCGAAPHDVQDLSLREIAMLQTLEPPKDWVLGPGEQSDFLMVFVGPPPNLREFAAEVVAVQSTGRRGGNTSSARAPGPGAG